MFVLGTGKWPEKGTLEAKDSALKADFYERTCANLTTGIRRGCIAWFVFFPLKELLTMSRQVMWRGRSAESAWHRGRLFGRRYFLPDK